MTDTFWPMLLGETGPIGMAAYAVFLGVIPTQLWQAARTASVRADRAIFLASLMVLVLGLVDSLAAPTFQAAPIAYFLYGTSGAARRSSRRWPPGRTQHGPVDRGRGRRIRSGGGGG